MVYPVTPTLSMDGFQDSDAEWAVTPVTTRPVGAVGGCVSEPPLETSSYAPTSHPLPWGREMPRWSVVPEQPGVLAGMRSTAGLPEGRAIVWVGPPLDASVPSRGWVRFKDVPVKPQFEPVSMLYPWSVIRAWPPQLEPFTPLATIDIEMERLKPV